MTSTMTATAMDTPEGSGAAPSFTGDESSRIFVKNLPVNMTDELLRKHFSAGGRHITDIRLIARRRIAFIGYRSPEEAKSAVRYFHRSYIRMSKLFVEVAKPIHEAPQYTHPSSGPGPRRPPEDEAEHGQPSKKRRLDEKADPKLREFLEVMKPQHGRGISSTADVFATVGSGLEQGAQLADGVTGTTRGGAAAVTETAALAAAEGESDDEYESLPAKPTNRRGGIEVVDATTAATPIQDRATAAEEGAEASKVVISATAIEEVDRNAADTTAPQQPPQPEGSRQRSEQLNRQPEQQSSQQPSQQKQQQQQKQADASATDDDWLRSRTNRLLDLLDPSELAPPIVTASPVLAESQTAEVAHVNDVEDSMVVDSAKPSEKEHKDVEVAASQAKTVSVSNEPVSPEDQIRETSRLFIRNLPYGAVEADFWKYFETFGSVKEVHLPVTNAGSNKGFAMVLFVDPSAALAAYHNADGRTFQGRILHVLPAKAKKSSTAAAMDEFALSQLPLKKQRLLRKKAEAASSAFSWNALFMSQDAVNAAVAERLGMSKSEILDPTSSDEAVRQAVRQTSIIEETKSYFAANGVDFDAFKPHTKRGDRCILVKNFAYGTTSQELRSMFEEYGPVVRVLMPSGGTIAIVQFAQAAHGRLAYAQLAYRRINDTLLMLEKCPESLFGESTKDELLHEAGVAGAEGGKKGKGPKVTAGELLGETASAEAETGAAAAAAAADTEAMTSSLFVRNLNFTTTTQQLGAAFAELDGFVSARVNTKPNPKKAGEVLSMGYGFVEFRSRAAAEAAVKTMNGFILQSHTLTVQAAHRGQQDAAADRREADRKRKQAANEGSKIIVKNLPFEATRKDLRTLLGTYGQLKAVRLPRKVGSGTRGYAFAEFVTPAEAAHAMEALRDTHLLGRRLVLQYAEAEALDPEEELAKMRKKVGSQVDRVALDQLTTGRRQRSRVQIGEDAAEDGAY